MTRSALWQQNVAYPAQLDRQLFQSIWLTPGVVYGLAVTTSVGRGVTIATGTAAVALGGGQGTELAYSDANDTATFPAAPVSVGTDRIDLLVAQIHDAAVDAGSTNGFTFDVTVGTPAAAPVAPALPARAVVIATVYSHGGQTNLAQVDITPGALATVVRPPAPAPPPSVYAGTLGAAVNMPNNSSPNVVMTTPALPPGTYQVAASFLTQQYGNSEFDFHAAIASGAATIYGAPALVGGSPVAGVSLQLSLTMTFALVVTSPTVLNFIGTAAGAQNALVQTTGNGGAGTGWSAIRVGN